MGILAITSYVKGIKDQRGMDAAVNKPHNDAHP